MESDITRRSSDIWVLDSDASVHVTSDKELLQDFQVDDAPQKTLLVCGQARPVHGRGTLRTQRFNIPDVLFVPGLDTNIISVGKLRFDHGISSVFTGSRVLLFTRAGTMVGRGILSGGGRYVLSVLFVGLDEDETLLAKSFSPESSKAKAKAAEQDRWDETDVRHITMSSSSYRRKLGPDLSDRWELDCVAQEHVTSNISLLSGVQIMPRETVLCFANGQESSVLCRGSVRTGKFSIPDVLYVPDMELTVNIVSIEKLSRDGLKIEVSKDGIVVTRDSFLGSEVVGRGHLDNMHRYMLEFLQIGQEDVARVQRNHLSLSGLHIYKQPVQSIFQFVKGLQSSWGTHGHDVTTMDPPSSVHAEGQEWVLDSVARMHHTCNPLLLLDLQEETKDQDQARGDGDDVLRVLGRGSLRTDGFEVPAVCYVEGGSRNVISVHQLSRDHGLVTVFESTECYVRDRATGQIVGRGRFRNGKYVLDALLIGQDVDATLLHKFSQEPSETKAAERDSSQSQTTMRIPWSVQTDHNDWVLDTRAPSHHTSNPQLLLGGAYPQETAKELPQSGGDGPLNVMHGHVRTILFHVPDVSYVEGDERNVISVSQLSSNHDLVIIFEPTRCYIKDKKTGQIVGRGHLHDSVYVLDSLHIGQNKGGRVRDEDKGKQEVEDDGYHNRDKGGTSQVVSEGADGQDGCASSGRRDKRRGLDGGDGGNDHARDSSGGEADDRAEGRAGGDGDNSGDDGGHGKGTKGGHDDDDDDEEEEEEEEEEKEAEENEKGDDEGKETERHQESSHGGLVTHPRYESLCPCGRNVLVILSGACEKCGLGPPRPCQRNDDTIAGAEGCVLHIPTQGESSSEPSMDFVMDSGAGSHMTWNGDPNVLQKYGPFFKPPVPSVTGVGGATCIVDGWGRLTTGTITLNDVLHVPDGGVNLVSVSKLVDAYQARVVFERKYFSIHSLAMSNEVIGNGHRAGTHYFLDNFNPDG